MMRSKTVKESFGFKGKICVEKGLGKDCISIMSKLNFGGNILLTIKRARELFEAGLQMCDELEKENNE